MPRAVSWTILLLIALLTLIPAFLIQQSTTTAGHIFKSALSRASTAFKNPTLLRQQTFTTIPANMTAKPRTPIYFLSHGGPNIMEDTTHPAYSKLQEIGQEITTKVKPKAIVVFSGHWQGFQDTIEVNTMEESPLIYDFYGFPAHYYDFKYPNTGSPALASKILSLLHASGIKAEGVRRGLDHGVWASFMCLFNPKTNPLNIPIVQVSLFDYFEADLHFNLGKAIMGLREEGVQIIVSGMAVHNLRDFGRTFGQPGALDYTLSFDEALRDAVEQKDASSREKAMTELLSRKDFKKAHPSADHLMPIYVGAGAAGEDQGTRLFTLAEGSMSWAQFRFGEVGGPFS